MAVGAQEKSTSVSQEGDDQFVEFSRQDCLLISC